MFAVRRRMLSYAHRPGSHRDQRGGQIGLHRQVRLQALSSALPTTRQALLTYSHAKCLSSRLTVTSRRRRHGVQSSTQGGGAAWRLRVGLRAGPGTAARLEAGNCGEVFARLFRVCAILPHQACTDGSFFFAVSCPKRVCRNPYGIFGLFWILLPVLTCTVQPVGHFHQHMQT